MSAFVLKLIAAATMLIDHAGIIFFPRMEIFRIIGRLAFPIYAFLIAEGFYYTRSRMKYFLRIFGLGLLCQLVYAVVEPELYLGVLITFSLSIVLLYFFDSMGKAFAGDGSRLGKLLKLSVTADRVLSATVFLVAAALVYLLTTAVEVDYGFFGILLPLFAYVSRDRRIRIPTFALGLLALSLMYGGVQPYCLLALIPLTLYNGKVGKYKLKYFFYLFYPLHLAVLYGLDILISYRSIL